MPKTCAHDTADATVFRRTGRDPRAARVVRGDMFLDFGQQIGSASQLFFTVQQGPPTNAATPTPMARMTFVAVHF